MRPIIFEVGTIIILLLITFFLVIHFQLIESSFIPYLSSSNSEVTVGVKKGEVLKQSNIPNNTEEIIQKASKNNALLFAKESIGMKGRIESLDFESGIDKESKAKYKVRIVLQPEGSSDLITIFYPEESIEVISVQSSTGEVMGIKDLKKGDLIDLTLNTRLYKKYPNNLISSTIIKY